jgi:hypothetical protein
LFTRFLIRCDSNIVIVVVVHISCRGLDTFPAIILLETLENSLPSVFTYVGIEKRTIMFTETDFNFDVALILVGFEDGKNVVGK